MLETLKIRQMVKAAILLGGTCAVGLPSPSFAAINCIGMSGCERKVCELNTELAIAEKMHNTQKVQSLQASLQRVEKSCSTADDRLADPKYRVQKLENEAGKYQSDIKHALANIQEEFVDADADSRAGKHSPVDIEQDVREELDDARAELKDAGEELGKEVTEASAFFREQRDTSGPADLKAVLDELDASLDILEKGRMAIAKEMNVFTTHIYSTTVKDSYDLLWAEIYGQIDKLKSLKRQLGK